ncbi:MAG: DNA internalization-related competence protein ComEC/Rec2 [Clostridia bacterium]|nr:DNA internalization-related competence protein ComEC/Rec2 [Clostridia bacterium]
MRAALRFVQRQVCARPLACFAVATVLGLMLRRRLSVPTLACAMALAASVGLGFALRRRRSVAAVLLLLAGLATGMTRMGLALDGLKPIQTRYSVEMVGLVTAEPFTNPDTGRCIFRFELETAGDAPSDLCLRMYLRGDPEPLEAIACGQRLRLKGHIWAPDPVTNPYEFDFGAYLNRQGMDAYATAKIEDVTILGSSVGVNTTLVAIRHAIARRIDALFPRSAGIMRALVLGDRSLLGDEQRDALQRSGTAHLISISGLHVTLLAAVLSLLLGLIMPRKYAVLVAVALLIPYGALIGFTAPFVRALCTFAIFCCAPIAGLPSDGITRLCGVMLAWLLAKPLSLEDTGFALSYAASAGIILLMPPLRRLVGLEGLNRRLPGVHGPRHALLQVVAYVGDLICASVAAQLATLPLVVASFGGQPLLSVPFNLICVPLCMAGYVLGLLALLVSVIFMPLAAMLARVPDALLAALTAITRAGGGIDGGYARIGRYPFILIVAHWSVMLAASDLSRIRLNVRRLMPLGLVGVAALSTLLVFMKAWPFTLVFLDAGQADCAVVQNHGCTWLIDAGDTYTPAADYLSANCLKLNGIVLSHPHEDHAGGLLDILDSFRPDAIYVPAGWFDVEEVAPSIVEGIEKARSMGIPIRELHTGDRIGLSSAASLEVYSPDGGALPAEVNDMSMLALVTCEGQKALFTGDLSQEGEPERIPDADVLKVAHHGSNKGTSARFLDSVTPDIAVISVGENNYGHPGEETLERLSASSAEIYQTRQSGAITMRHWGGAWHIQTFQEAVNEVE